MAKTIKPSQLGAAIEKELTLYHKNATEKVDQASEKAVKEMVKLTKATAPEGARKSFKKHIASKLLKKSSKGSTYVWYVRPPDHRLTHLLAHGHATKDGGRTRANSFISDAESQVLPDYEKAVKEALK